jgi:hypothetical protein
MTAAGSPGTLSLNHQPTDGLVIRQGEALWHTEHVVAHSTQKLERGVSRRRSDAREQAADAGNATVARVRLNTFPEHRPQTCPRCVPEHFVPARSCSS